MQRHLPLMVVLALDRVDSHGQRQAGMCGNVLDQPGKGLVEALKEAALDVLAFEAQVAHGFKESILLRVVPGPVSHFKQGIVGVIEQHLQTLSQLLRGLVANLKRNHRQAGERRWTRLIGSALMQRHHIPVVVHPSLLKGITLRSGITVKPMANARTPCAAVRVMHTIRFRCSGGSRTRQSYDVNLKARLSGKSRSECQRTLLAPLK
ncbi:hypothetical protein D3C84_713620 [compost metagenome]